MTSKSVSVCMEVLWVVLVIIDLRPSSSVGNDVTIRKVVVLARAHSSHTCIVGSGSMRTTDGGSGARALGRLLRQHQRHDEAVQCERLAENEHQQHAREHLVAVGVVADLANGAHTGITRDADGQAGGEGAEATRQTGAQVRVTLEEGVVVLATRRGRHCKETA